MSLLLLTLWGLEERHHRAYYAGGKTKVHTSQGVLTHFSDSLTPPSKDPSSHSEETRVSVELRWIRGIGWLLCDPEPGNLARMQDSDRRSQRRLQATVQTSSLGAVCPPEKTQVWIFPWKLLKTTTRQEWLPVTQGGLEHRPEHARVTQTQTSPRLGWRQQLPLGKNVMLLGASLHSSARGQRDYSAPLSKCTVYC